MSEAERLASELLSDLHNSRMVACLDIAGAAQMIKQCIEKAMASDVASTGKSLWVLKRLITDSTPVYDCCDGFVVRAPTEVDARHIAANRAGDEGGSVWLTRESSSCEELASVGDDGVLMMDFHAG